MRTDLSHPIKTILTLCAVLALSACNVALAGNPQIIPLNSSEKAKAMSLLERRQAISIKKQKLDAQYAGDVDRLNEEINDVNIDASQLCFELKKAHALPPNVNYQVDEVNARLVKQ